MILGETATVKPDIDFNRPSFIFKTSRKVAHRV